MSEAGGGKKKGERRKPCSGVTGAAQAKARVATEPRGSASRALTVVLGNQLFAPERLRAAGLDGPVFMAEDRGLCTYFRHHRYKLVLFLAAMRRHAQELRAAGFEVHYEYLEAVKEEGAEVTSSVGGPHPPGGTSGSRASEFSYEAKLARHLDLLERGGRRIERLRLFEVEDRFFERRLVAFAKERGLELEFLESPMFLTSRAEFASYLASVGKPFMKTFYQRQRRRLKVLLDSSGEPEGGRWSFDEENRKKLPPDVTPPPLGPLSKPGPELLEVLALVRREFGDHPGPDAPSYESGFWLPTSRDEALSFLRVFLAERIGDFGPYEDALTARSDFVFHSALSPALNLGLLTPDEVLREALLAASVSRKGQVPLASLEGFVRQLIGWREFVRGIDRHFGERQESLNRFSHTRRLRPCWYGGGTGLPPLDAAIAKVRRLGYLHHIERLMVVGNLMVLCEIAPAEAYRWFMEMFVDSSDWVMGPNVYGMGIFSDGGIFATKPYVSGSAYILRMSDAKKGPWCEVWDGLYWSFIAKHQEEFLRNPRMATMARLWAKLPEARKSRLLEVADRFRADVTF